MLQYYANLDLQTVDLAYTEQNCKAFAVDDVVTVTGHGLTHRWWSFQLQALLSVDIFPHTNYHKMLQVDLILHHMALQ